MPGIPPKRGYPEFTNSIPATITGSADHPQVAIDVSSMAKRAVTNKANEEAQKAISKGLSGFLKKK